MLRGCGDINAGSGEGTAIAGCPSNGSCAATGGAETRSCFGGRCQAPHADRNPSPIRERSRKIAVFPMRRGRLGYSKSDAVQMNGKWIPATVQAGTRTTQDMRSVAAACLFSGCGMGNIVFMNWIWIGCRNLKPSVATGHFAPVISTFCSYAVLRPISATIRIFR